MICLGCREGRHEPCREAHEAMFASRGTGPEMGSQNCDCQHHQEARSAGGAEVPAHQ